MMAQFVLWIRAVAVLAPLLVAGALCEAGETPQEANPADHSQLRTKVEKLLKHRTWFHRSYAPVGFVLNFFHFDDHEFKIENKYVNDEGGVMREAVYLGSWFLSDTSSNVVKAHFDVTKPSDDGVPRPWDLTLRTRGR